MQQSSSSKIIWIIVFVSIVIVVGGFFYYYRMQKSAAPPDTKTEATDGLSAAGTAEVEAELEAINLEGLDAELGDIEKEIAQ